MQHKLNQLKYTQKNQRKLMKKFKEKFLIQKNHWEKEEKKD